VDLVDKPMVKVVLLYCCSDVK